MADTKPVLLRRSCIMIRDVLYGIVTLPEFMRPMVNHPIFQRLGGLKQLGHTYFVYPSATHTRKEHSMGTCHLTRTWAEHLLLGFRDERAKRLINQGLVDLLGLREQWSKAAPSFFGLLEGDRLEEAAVDLVGTAALFHDLGHGPMSHLFDQLTGTDHEDRSRDLAGVVLKDCGVPEWEIALVQGMIHGECGFLGSLVCNTDTGIDADKLDYLSRDFHHLGMPFGSDATRLIHSSFLAVDPDRGVFRVAFPMKEVWNIAAVYTARFTLHKLVCRHHTVIAADLALERVLKRHGVDMKDQWCTDAGFSGDTMPAADPTPLQVDLAALQTRRGFPRVRVYERVEEVPEVSSADLASGAVVRGEISFNTAMPSKVRRNLWLINKKGDRVTSEEVCPAVTRDLTCTFIAHFDAGALLARSAPEE